MKIYRRACARIIKSHTKKDTIVNEEIIQMESFADSGQHILNLYSADKFKLLTVAHNQYMTHKVHDGKDNVVRTSCQRVHQELCNTVDI